MHDVKIERQKITAEMQLRIVVERTAAITIEALFERPAKNVAQCVEIEMQIERDPVVEPEIIVVNCPVKNHAETKRDDFSALSPNEKARPLRHALAHAAKIFFGQSLELHGRSFMDLEIERIDLIDIRRDVIDHRHLDRCRAFRLAEFSAQIFRVALPNV